jgi:hypothetical protein
MDSTKSAAGRITLNLCFSSQWNLRVMQCIPVRLGHEISMHYFSCMGGLGVVSIKIRSGHVTLKLCCCIKWNLWVT